MNNLEAELERINEANAKRVKRVKDKIRKRDEAIQKNFVELVKEFRSDVYAEYWRLAETEYQKSLEAKSAKRSKPVDEKVSSDGVEEGSAADQQNVLGEAENIYG